MDSARVRARAGGRRKSDVSEINGAGEIWIEAAAAKLDRVVGGKTVQGISFILS